MSPDLNALVSGCQVMSRAKALADWVGRGRAVTASGVLRRADVHDVAQTLGISLPGQFRSAADVAALHRPWIVAQAAGFLTVSQGRAAAAPNPPVATPKLWLAGLDAVCRAESDERHQHGAAIACRHVLTVLATGAPPTADVLEDTVHQLLEADGDTLAVFQAFQRGLMPVEAAVGLLQEFGAIDQRQTITDLGRWGLDQLRNRIPEPILPDLSPRQLLTRLTDLPDEEIWTQGWTWLRGRRADEAAEALLAAAADATPRERITAVNLLTQLGDQALPAWHQALHHPSLAAHARAVLADWDQSPGPNETDQRWLATEYALAAIEDDDPYDAGHTVHAAGGLEAAEASGHPGATELAQALSAYVAGGGGQPHIQQLKISLSRVRPPVWRRVQVPDHATLADLNHIIKIVMDWGEEHLHIFTVGSTQYSDPLFDLEECSDQGRIRLARALPHLGSKIAYRYDLGDCWDHEIILEKSLAVSDTVAYPFCVTGRGDAPIEDWNPDDPEEPAPFDREDLNRRLSKLAMNACPTAPVKEMR
ncbi:plasmid pRiA4b ORF-3 family protein [Actinomadura sp. 6N118]|uniref:plasmid pRiA4b ORF-3 family protein n=1 Tax=Actinomadura sp. 6N118 TaxID=3375151 RepID=UPI0037995AD7